MHVIVGLLREGYRVGAIDLDARQATLTRYLEARAATAAKRGVPLPLPSSRAVHASRAETRREAEAEDEAAPHRGGGCARARGGVRRHRLPRG
ncbi:MAG: division plane positioning ATPase MipZ [Acetobacteraceae bacterium]|nr:division plane positioning ATPase MipZ [Acetobacteraceae bacterium]